MTNFLTTSTIWHTQIHMHYFNGHFQDKSGSAACICLLSSLSWASPQEMERLKLFTPIW